MTSTAKHTPGPWKIEYTWIMGGTHYATGALKIARVFERNPAMGFSDAPYKAEMDANAQLIAASPAMAGALRTALQIAPKEMLATLWGDEARAALRAAGVET